MIPNEIREKLQAKTMKPKPPPNVRTLVEQTPDVVAFLRSQMTARPKMVEGVRSGKQESRPPFRIAAMSAADREVAVLAKWFQYFGGRIIWPMLWDQNTGKVAGLVNSDLTPVVAMSVWFGKAADGYTPVGMLDDLWSTRCTHYSAFPDLAAMFIEDEPAEVPVVEGLF